MRVVAKIIRETQLVLHELLDTRRT